MIYRLIVDISQLMNQGKQYQNIELMILKLDVRRDKLTHLKQELLMMESGREDSGTVMVSKSGLMAPYMKVNGKIIEHMDKVNLLILMVIFTKDNG